MDVGGAPRSGCRSHGLALAANPQLADRAGRGTGDYGELGRWRMARGKELASGSGIGVGSAVAFCLSKKPGRGRLEIGGRFGSFSGTTALDCCTFFYGSGGRCDGTDFDRLEAASLADDAEYVADPDGVSGLPVTGFRDVPGQSRGRESAVRSGCSDCRHRLYGSTNIEPVVKKPCRGENAYEIEVRAMRWPRDKRDDKHVITRWKEMATETRGSEIAEFAAVLPVLIMLLLAIMSFARAYNVYTTITYAAQEGARTAATSTCATCGNSPLWRRRPIEWCRYCKPRKLIPRQFRLILERPLRLDATEVLCYARRDQTMSRVYQRGARRNNSRRRSGSPLLRSPGR